MKLPKTCLIMILLLALNIDADSQEPPKAVLVDEFGLITCGDLLARTDSLAAELKREPDAMAFIVIHPPTVRPELATRWLRRISSTLQLRGLEQDRFSMYKGGPSVDGEIRTQFWKMPNGAEPPFADGVLWTAETMDTSRAFIFGYEDEYGICPTFVPKALAKLILENPGSRGHIVVRVGDDPTVNRFYFAEAWIKELVEKQDVPRKRFRLFFAKGKGLTEAEFWFVPAKKEK